MSEMGPLVAVHVDPSPNDPRELAVLLDSCSRALPQGRCGSEQEVGPEAPAAFASVRWLDEWRAHIDARIGSVQPLVVTRDLAFAPSDPRLARFRSVGLAIATIVDELEVQKARAAVAPPEAGVAEPRRGEPAPVPTVATRTPPTAVARPTNTAPPPEARPAGAASAEHFSESAEVGGLFGTGLLGEAPRAGLYLRLAHDLSSLPVFVSVSGSYALSVSSATPLVAWTDIGLGGGGCFVAGSVRLEAGVRALLDHTSATAPDPNTGREDTASSFIPGLALDARIAWPDRGAVALTFGADGSFLLREVRITNAGDEVARISAYNVGIVGGLRLKF